MQGLNQWFHQYEAVVAGMSAAGTLAAAVVGAVALVFAARAARAGAAQAKVAVAQLESQRNQAWFARFNHITSSDKHGASPMQRAWNILEAKRGDWPDAGTPIDQDVDEVLSFFEAIAAYRLMYQRGQQSLPVLGRL